MHRAHPTCGFDGLREPTYGDLTAADGFQDRSHRVVHHSPGNYNRPTRSIGTDKRGTQRDGDHTCRSTGPHPSTHWWHGHEWETLRSAQVQCDRVSEVIAPVARRQDLRYGTPHRQYCRTIQSQYASQDTAERHRETFDDKWRRLSVASEDCCAHAGIDSRAKVK